MLIAVLLGGPCDGKGMVISEDQLKDDKTTLLVPWQRSENTAAYVIDTKTWPKYDLDYEMCEYGYIPALSLEDFNTKVRLFGFNRTF